MIFPFAFFFFSLASSLLVLNAVSLGLLEKTGFRSCAYIFDTPECILILTRTRIVNFNPLDIYPFL